MRRNNLARRVLDCHRLLISLAFLILLLSMPVSVVFAHKVNIFAYAEGDTVYTESYFSDGKEIKGGIVEVYDSQGIKLLEGKTDENGKFDFKLPKKDDLNIVLLASLGHKNSYTLPADELIGIIGAEKPQEPESREFKSKEVTESTPSPFPLPSGERIEVRGETELLPNQVDLEQIMRIIETSLDEKLKPIMRELTKAQQKEVSFTEVIGGIGYIFGIMGIIFYFAGKKKEGKNKDAST